MPECLVWLWFKMNAFSSVLYYIYINLFFLWYNLVCVYLLFWLFSFGSCSPVYVFMPSACRRRVRLSLSLFHPLSIFDSSSYFFAGIAFSIIICIVSIYVHTYGYHSLYVSVKVSLVSNECSFQRAKGY